MPDLTPTARHMALAAEAVTAGPHHERDIVERVATLLAAIEAHRDDTADHARARRRLAEDALANPRLEMFARELRLRGWRPPAGFSCGCNPVTGLCPSHAAVRDYEAATVTA